MKENKRIEKELLFKNNVKDITSISLDSDFKINNQEIVGNFIISGEYKIHEISLNREKFNFKIPFKHEIESDIDLDTVNVEITNFLYDYKKDELIVNIEYDILGDRKDVLIFDDKESLEEFLNSREVEVVDTRIDEIKEEIETLKEVNKKEESKENIKEVIEETKKNKIVDQKEESKETLKNEIKEEIIEKKDNDDRINAKEKIENKPEEKMNVISDKEVEKVSSDEIINNINSIEDGFVTYKIYKIKENETLESIVIKNKTTIDELKEYNDLNNLNINDKLIIPVYE